MRSLGRRLGAALASAVLLLVAQRVLRRRRTSGQGRHVARRSAQAPRTCPSRSRRKGTLKKPDPLTQLSTSCVGIEQGVLYDADWTVEARKYFDDDQWSVTTAVFTPPSGTSGDDGARAGAHQSRSECIAEEPEATVEPLDLGGDTYAYQVQDAQGGFDSARAYVALDDGGARPGQRAGDAHRRGRRPRC